MSQWLIALVALIYAVVAFDHARRGDFPLALTWAAYAVANIGLMFARSTPQ